MNLSQLEELADACMQRIERDGTRAVDEICAEHPEHATELRRILRNLLGVGLIEDGDPADGLPRTMGDFVLESRLGAGGMGVVYAAEQPSLGRRVALKLLRADALSAGSARERFAREVAAVSKLDHPGICTVYEAGAIDESPYLAMRLVEGETLEAKIARQRAAADRVPGRPSTRGGRSWLTDVVGWMERVAEAVEAAHRAGIVHRDIKPANIMIDRHGEPVVLDFGLARALDRSEGTLTRTGDQPGTPAYMAPEQVDDTRGGIDGRTDVYALGATLYECLTLRQPFASSSRNALFRSILTEEPPDPTRINRHVGSELRAVVARAMEKDPRRRFHTAAELADELRRIRTHQPILTRPPGAWLRTWRLAQRHPVRATVFIALVLGFAITTWGFFAVRDERDRARKAEQQARVDATRAHQVIDLVKKMVGSADPDECRGRNYTVRELLDEFDRDLAAALTTEPEVQADIRSVVGMAYLGLGLIEKSKPHLQAALDLRRQVLDDDHELVIESLLQMSELLVARGEYPAAKKLAAEARQRTARRFGSDAPEMARVLRTEARLELILGKLDAAEAAGRRALELEPAGADGYERTKTRIRLAQVLSARGEYELAEPIYRDVVEVRTGRRPANHPDVIDAWRELAGCLSSLGEAVEATQILDKVLELAGDAFGDSHPAFASVLLQKSVSASRRGDYEQSEKLARRAYQLLLRLLPAGHPRIAMAEYDLGACLVYQGKFAEAERIHRRSLATLTELYDDDHPEVAAIRNALGFTLAHQKKLEEAREYLRPALAAREALFDDSHPQVAVTRGNLAFSYMLEGRFADAEPLFRKVADATRGVRLGEPVHAGALLGLATCCEYLKGREESVPLYEDALAAMRADRGEEHPGVAIVLHDLGSVHELCGRLEEAERAYQQARRIFGKRPRRDCAQTLRALGDLLVSLKRHADAADVFRDLVQATRRYFGANTPELRAAQHSLGLALFSAGRRDLALPHFEAALAICRELRERHDVMVDCLHKAGWCQTTMGDHGAAVKSFEAAVQLFREKEAREHPYVANCLHDIARVLNRARRHAEARTVIEECLALARRTLQRDGPLFWEILNTFGTTMALNGDHAAAIPAFREAEEIMRVSAPDNWRRYDSMAMLGLQLAHVGRFEEAEAQLLESQKHIRPPADHTAYADVPIRRLVILYEMWKKPEKAALWRKRLPQTSGK